MTSTDEVKTISSDIIEFHKEENVLSTDVNPTSNSDFSVSLKPVTDAINAIESDAAKSEANNMLKKLQETIDNIVTETFQKMNDAMSVMDNNYTIIITEIQSEYQNTQSAIDKIKQEITTHTEKTRQDLSDLLLGVKTISADAINNFHEAGEAIKTGVDSSVTKIENSLEIAVSTIQEKLTSIETTVASDSKIILTDLKCKQEDLENKIVETRTIFVNENNKIAIENLISEIKIFKIKTSEQAEILVQMAQELAEKM